MKKLFLFLILTLSILSIRAQDLFVGYRVATPTTQIGRNTQAGNFIFVESTKRIIEVTKSFLPNATAVSIIASGSYRDFTPFYGSSTTLQLPTSILPVTNYTGTIGSSSYAWGALYLKGVTLTSAGQYTITVTDTHTGALNMYGVFTSTNPASNIQNSTYIGSNWLAGARTTGTNSNFTNDSATNVVAGTLVKTASVYCTASLGAIFKGTDGNCYRLSVPAGTYTTVACP